VDEALMQEIGQWLEDQPDHSKATALLAASLEETGDLGEALAVAQKAADEHCCDEGDEGVQLSFDEGKHPRGHEGNPGQFAAKGGGHTTPKFKSEHHRDAHSRATAALESADLPAEAKEAYHATVTRALESMPGKALEAFHKGSNGFSFHASGEEVAVASAESEIQSHKDFSARRREDAKKWWSRILGQSESLNLYADIADRMGALAEKRKVRAVAGSFSPFDGKLYLDGEGDKGAVNQSDPAEYRIDEADYNHHVYLHEMTHAVDRGAGNVSDRSDFKQAWKAELEGGGLTRYAGTSASEGFAEFGRVLFSGVVPATELEQRFKKTSSIFKRLNLWPS
jgi:hypothetical protein